MFETLVLVCLSVNPNICHGLQDLNGPYKTEKECVARAYEIAKDLPTHMPDYLPMKYKCANVSDKRIDKSI